MWRRRVLLSFRLTGLSLEYNSQVQRFLKCCCASWAWLAGTRSVSEGITSRFADLSLRRLGNADGSFDNDTNFLLFWNFMNKTPSYKRRWDNKRHKRPCVYYSNCCATFHLILLSGDIEANPGPSTAKCCFCAKVIQ